MRPTQRLGHDVITFQIKVEYWTAARTIKTGTVDRNTIWRCTIE